MREPLATHFPVHVPQPPSCTMRLSFLPHSNPFYDQLPEEHAVQLSELLALRRGVVVFLAFFFFFFFFFRFVPFSFGFTGSFLRFKKAIARG